MKLTIVFSSFILMVGLWAVSYMAVIGHAHSVCSSIAYQTGKEWKISFSGKCFIKEKDEWVNADYIARRTQKSPRD